jgi:magnesium chelatase subunit D
LPPTGAAGRAQAGTRARAEQPFGRFVRDVAVTDDAPDVAVHATAVAVATKRAAQPGAAPDRDDLRAAVREQRTGNLVVVAVDTSASMGAHERIAFAKAAVLGLLTDAYQRRDRVAVVAFRGQAAEVVLRPTGSVEVARRRLAELPIGGTTPLADAIHTAWRVAESGRHDELEPVVVLVTDGRATYGGDDPVAAAREAAQRSVATQVPALVIDAELGTPRLGLAADLAQHLGAECVALEGLAAGDLRSYLR